jgi:sRNA-binding regulator protein Hfq
MNKRYPRGHDNHNNHRERGGRQFSGNNKERSGPPESTEKETRYIKQLIDNKIPVIVRLVDNQEFSGTIEYYDTSFIRLTRTDGPNLFIYKHQIKYLYESP